VRQIARDLGVGSVLDGSVRSAGERVRVTVQLVEADIEFQPWSRSFNRNRRAALGTPVLRRP
jgi:adenylate cyclase